MKKLIATFALCAAVLAGSPASAASLINETRLMQGGQTVAFELTVSGPGTLTVRLDDLNWLGRLENLSFAVAGTQGPSLQAAGSPPRLGLNAPAMEYFAATGGNRTFEISGSGKYYAYVSGLAGGPYGMGLFAFNATFNSVAPVPLPDAAWLFGVGLVAFGVTLPRRRRQAADAAGGDAAGGEAGLLPAAA